MIVEDKIVERTMFGCTESGKMNEVGILSHGVLFFFQVLCVLRQILGICYF
jgi:hypothetical protein